MRKMAFSLAALALAGCASTPSGPDWRDHVIPGPDGTYTSEHRSSDRTPDESRAYALRFARSACNDAGGRLVITDTDSQHIGPTPGGELANTVAHTAAAVYYANRGYGYKANQPPRWLTVVSFTCDG